MTSRDNAPPLKDDGWTLHHGDCLDVLPTLNPVDSVVTDPPYGLEFMERDWDHGVPGVPYWTAVLDALKPGGHLLAFGGTRTHHRLMVGIEDAGFEIRDVIMWVYGSGFPKSHNVGISLDKHAGEMGHRGRAHYAYATGKDFQSREMSAPQSMPRHAPITDAAKQWDGWGSALKPAWEPIIIARKPLEGTLAQNVLAHGVGGINIDGCRVASGADSLGRWPANLIHDGSDDVTRLMPARFFYCAKATQSDRDEGLDDFAIRTAGELTHRTEGSKGINPYAGGRGPKRNTHPTVKPLALMRYLVRLVTPPGGTVCDPFMGSGSTGKAADLEGCHFVGIEADRDSYHIATQRRRKQQSFRYD